LTYDGGLSIFDVDVDVSCAAVMTELRRATAITGVGATDYTKNSGRSVLHLAAEATAAALADAGLTPGC
jgi:3-oxoacyl-[acyl-carrier-protein] synthase III